MIQINNRETDQLMKGLNEFDSEDMRAFLFQIVDFHIQSM